MKKYELIKESKTYFEEREIFRIRALKDFRNVKAGDIGGWVCSYDNLSQEGYCWIYGNAKCLDNAMVSDNAMMIDNSKMFDNSRMYDNAIMCDNSMMHNNSMMCNRAIMRNSSMMFDNSKMFDTSIMYDEAVMCNSSMMVENARMYYKAIMSDNAVLDGNKLLYGSINKSYKKIFQHYCERRLLTAILTKENEILYSIGCQIGITKEKFIDRIHNDCEVRGKGLEECPYRQEYLKIIDMAENYLRKFI